MICVVIEGPLLRQARQQIAEALPHADLLELRLDRFEGWTLEEVQALRSACPLPLIFTLRGRAQGGAYPGTEAARLADLRRLAALAPAYLDLESDAPLSFLEELSLRFPNVQRLLSHHDWEGIPRDLDRCYRAMREKPAHLYKLAVTPPNSVEALRFLEWAKGAGGRLIALPMGREASFGRLLAPFAGSPIAYASLEENALGQIPARRLAEHYSYHRLTSRTVLYALIGDPVSRSPSDHTHNRLIQRLGLEALYVKIPLRPEELSDFLDTARRLPFAGLSVTMPLKTEILPFLDRIDPQAREIGAVNTLRFEKGGKINGFNTDGIGALNALEREGPMRGKRMVILGVGGAARAIAHEALRRGARVALFSRNAEQAEAAAKRLGCEGHGWDQLAAQARTGYDVLINGTPAPMPLDPAHLLPRTLAMEIALHPTPTPFLECASAKGCRVLNGYPMFVEQAAIQFQLWFHDRLLGQPLQEELKAALRTLPPPSSVPVQPSDEPPAPS